MFLRSFKSENHKRLGPQIYPESTSFAYGPQFYRIIYDRKFENLQFIWSLSPLFIHIQDSMHATHKRHICLENLQKCSGSKNRSLACIGLQEINIRFPCRPHFLRKFCHQ
jgi:hypothetical protein